MFVWFFHWEVLIVCVLILLWYSSFFGISSIGGMGKLLHVNPNLLYDIALIYSLILGLMLIHFMVNFLRQTESCPFGYKSRGIFCYCVKIHYLTAPCSLTQCEQRNFTLDWIFCFKLPNTVLFIQFCVIWSSCWSMLFLNFAVLHGSFWFLTHGVSYVLLHFIFQYYLCISVVHWASCTPRTTWRTWIYSHPQRKKIRGITIIRTHLRPLLNGVAI